MKKLVILPLIVLIPLLLFSQNSIESLKKDFSNAKYDSTRVRLYIEIGQAFGYTQPDSAILYYEKAIEHANNTSASLKTVDNLSLLKAHATRYIGNVHLSSYRDFETAASFYLKAYNIYNELKNVRGMSDCYKNLGTVFSYRGMYGQSLEYYNKALEINEGIGNKKEIAQCYINIGHAQYDLGYYDIALENYLEALRISEEINDRPTLPQCYNSIGIVHKTLGNREKSIEYYEKALELFIEFDNKKWQANIYNNLGNVYFELKDYDKTIELYLKTLDIFEAMGDRYGKSAAYTNIGNVYLNKGNYQEVIKYYKEALKIKEDINDKQGMVLLYNNIAILNYLLADSTSFEEKRISLLNQAIENAQKSFNLAKDLNTKPAISEAALSLFQSYKRKGNCNQALKYLEIFSLTKDTILNEDRTRALTEMQTKYETEKKQQEIEKQQLVIEKQEIDNRRQRTQLNFTIGGIVLLALLAFAIFSGYQQKKRSNIIISEKNVMLEQANEEISAQRDEIESQRDMVIAQKEHIEFQKKKIDDSIRYAERIQSAVIPSPAKLELMLNEHFIIFRPKDVVSGDFYWTTRIGDILIVAVADCTGHGVPGAFMSMLGMSFLNEIVRRKEITTPAQVLNALRNSVIEALGQTISHDSQKDGMDISLVALDTSTNRCLWAGAGNPLWIIRNEKIGKSYENPTDLIEIIKPDIMPIAISQKMNAFTDHEIQLSKNDRIYLFSDGIVDQFGGPDERKFMTKQLKQIIAQTAHYSLEEQKHTLETTLDAWLSPMEGVVFEQIDDITVLGIKI